MISQIALLTRRDLGGIHFTGSTASSSSMWKTIGANIGALPLVPAPGRRDRRQGLHRRPSLGRPQALAVAIVRGGFEYQGQKCSAASRVYVPQSLWTEVRDRAVAMMRDIKMGDVRDFRNFMGAVIDEKAFTKISGYLDDATQHAQGRCRAAAAAATRAGSSSRRWSRPRIPGYRLLCEEIFGPVVTAYVYPDDKWRETLTMVDRTSPYALTGAIFARDRGAIREASAALRNAAGNFYINDKPTGAVVGQQPFGGARASGTNDKAGSKLNLLRWVSARSIKETFNPPRDYRYPFMGEE